jgi:hypothetical protein
MDKEISFYPGKIGETFESIIDPEAKRPPRFQVVFPAATQMLEGALWGCNHRLGRAALALRPRLRWVVSGGS